MTDAHPRLSRGTRHTVLTVHIAASVALLGGVLGLAAIGLAARGAAPAAAQQSYEIASMFSMAFGIPLSLISLVSGIVLGLGTQWGLLRHWWVTVKLGAIVAVMAVGALLIGPAEGRLIDGPITSSDEWLIVAGAGVQAALLTGSTALSVFKPGRRRPTSARRTRPAAEQAA